MDLVRELLLNVDQELFQRSKMISLEGNGKAFVCKAVAEVKILCAREFDQPLR